MIQPYWREIYKGEEKIVISMDIGTTHSTHVGKSMFEKGPMCAGAVAFAHLLKGNEPLVHMVTDWPGKPGAAKIPTIAAYDGTQGMKWGAEAEATNLRKKEKGYTISKWFKLHLHPPSMRVTTGQHEDFDIPELPDGVKIRKIYADFMAYLMKCTQDSFGKRLPNGKQTWRRLRKTAVIILTIPNGWDQTQQEILRKAAVEANLVTEATERDCLEFVTEAEASVHWVVAHGGGSWLSENSVFAVVDAGGSTVDSTLYKCVAMEPKLILSEACMTGSECVQAGGIFVDRAARKFLRAKLYGSRLAEPKNLDHIEAEFSDKVKSTFDGTQEEMRVTLGATFDHDDSLSETDGELWLKQQEISDTFEAVIEGIKESIRKLMGDHEVTHLTLVGGFGESPYLQMRLRKEFKAMRRSMFIPGDPSKKAAGEGGLIWFLQKLVTTRIAKITLGMEVTPDYDPTNGEHRIREHLVIDAPNGARIVPDGYCVLIQKGEVIDEDFTREQEFHVFCETEMEKRSTFKLYVWEGEGAPKWITSTRGKRLPGMSDWGYLEINWDDIYPFLRLQHGDDIDFYEIDFKVVIKPKGTQLQAVIQAQYEDTICEGPITLVPNAVSKE